MRRNAVRAALVLGALCSSEAFHGGSLAAARLRAAPAKCTC